MWHSNVMKDGKVFGGEEVSAAQHATDDHTAAAAVSHAEAAAAAAVAAESDIVTFDDVKRSGSSELQLKFLHRIRKQVYLDGTIVKLLPVGGVAGGRIKGFTGAALCAWLVENRATRYLHALLSLPSFPTPSFPDYFYISFEISRPPPHPPLLSLSLPSSLPLSLPLPLPPLISSLADAVELGCMMFDLSVATPFYPQQAPLLPLSPPAIMHSVIFQTATLPKHLLPSGVR
jgi:hypothetical protein